MYSSSLAVAYLKVLIGLLRINWGNQQLFLAHAFLQRLKLTTKLDTTAKKKTAQILSDQKLDLNSIDNISEEFREDFCVKASKQLFPPYFRENSAAHIFNN